MVSVEQFVSHMRRFGISTKNRFDVSIPFPQALINAIGDSGSGALLNQADPTGTLRAVTDELNLTDGRGPLALARQMGIVCIGARIPGVNINTVDGPWLGHDHKVANGSNSEDAEFIFIVSRDGAERSVFEKWTNLICDHTTGKVGYYDDYVSETIRITPSDEFNGNQHYIEMVECYPVTVNSIDLDRTATNDYQVITVSFAFRRLKPRGSTGFIETIMESKAGQMVDAIASGDFNAAAQHARDVAIDIKNGAYAGEALGAFDMISEASHSIGINPKATRKTLNAMKPDIITNPRIGDDDKDGLSGLIDDIIG